MPLTRPKSEQINFDVTNLTDPLIRLNSGESGSADKDAGIVIERGSDTNVGIIYDESADQFAVINTSETGTTSGNVTIASYANIKANEFHGDGSNLTGISAGGVTGITSYGVQPRIGISETTPDAKLEIKSASETGLHVESSVAGEVVAQFKAGGTGDTPVQRSMNSSGTTLFEVMASGKVQVPTGAFSTNGTYDGYGNNLMGNDETLAIISKTNYKAAYSLRHNGSGTDAGTTVFYHATQASMSGGGSDISSGIYVQNGQRWGIGHGTTRSVEVTADGDVRSRYWVGNGTGAGYKLNADSNQGMILLETNLTSARDLMHFNNGNGLVGKIQTSGSSTSFITSSDYRLKENVDYDWDATTRLKQLKPARFNFIADSDNTLVDGFIAHEVSSVVPEAVLGSKDAMKPILYTSADAETQGESPTKAIGEFKEFHSSEIDPQGIDQSKLVPLLVKTIQELEARITALES